MKTTKHNLLDDSLILEAEELPVFEHACKLYRAGFHITVLHDNLKYPKDKKWNKKRMKPVLEMTGVGLVTGTENNDEFFVFALDIDIYRHERRDIILQKICDHLDKNLYIEITPSGGYRIVFFCETCAITKANLFDFSEENDNAIHKDNIELFAGLKQIVIAPSRAVNKQGEVGEYKQISKVGLQESSILNEYELKSLREILEVLSKQYSSQIFQHKHLIPSERREGIRQLHQYLKLTGCITGPLYNGERHCSIPCWKNGVNDAAFNKENLTGIVLKLGKQADGYSLSAFDIDIKVHKSGELPMDVMEQFKVVFGDSFYSERSVSGECNHENSWTAFHDKSWVLNKIFN